MPGGTSAAEAVPRDREHASSPELRLPVVKGELQRVPADAIVLELAPTELRIGGVKVLALEEGHLPQPPVGEDAPGTKVREALLAELEVRPGEAVVSLAIAADVRVPNSAIVRVAELAALVEIRTIGLVARSGLSEQGFIQIPSPSRATPGVAVLRVDGDGFHLTSPSGKTLHISAPYDVETLGAKVLALADAQSDWLPLFLEADADVPARVFVDVLARLDQPGCYENDTCRDVRVRLRRTARGEAESQERRAAFLTKFPPEEGHFFESPYGAEFMPDLTAEDLERYAPAAKPMELPSRAGSSLPAPGRKTVPRVRQAKVTVKGPLEKDIIRRTVRTNIGDVRSCYDAGLSKSPGLEGRVTIDFTIGGKGKVTASSVTSTTLNDEGTGACIVDAAKRWEFPKPKGGGAVSVTLPFRLELR